MHLERDHLSAAALLWDRLEELKRSDRALAALQGCFPTFDSESTLLKVLALDSVITQRTHQGHSLAARFQKLLAIVDLEKAGPELVDALAAIASEFGKRSYEGLGFASRFAHFFIDVERFPILNGWSERSLQWLLGRPLQGDPGDRRYARFSREFDWVARRLGLTRRRDMGHWLWLAGQYRAWLKNPRSPVHAAARELFEAGPPELQRLLPRAPTRIARDHPAEEPVGPLPRKPSGPSPFADTENHPCAGLRKPGAREPGSEEEPDPVGGPGADGA